MHSKFPRTSCSRWWLREKVRINVNQRFALKDAADAHKALEARATAGSSILTI
jgi:NADPH:quinone reductase